MSMEKEALEIYLKELIKLKSKAEVKLEKEILKHNSKLNKIIEEYPTVNDIVGNPKNIVIKELAANTIPSALNDVTAAAINGNYALDFNIDPKTAIVKDTLEDKEYWNLIAARTADLKDKEKVAVYDKIVKAYQSAATEDVYNNKFSGYYIKTGWGIDELEQYK